MLGGSGRPQRLHRPATTATCPGDAVASATRSACSRSDTSAYTSSAKLTSGYSEGRSTDHRLEGAMPNEHLRTGVKKARVRKPWARGGLPLLYLGPPPQWGRRGVKHR